MKKYGVRLKFNNLYVPELTSFVYASSKFVKPVRSAVSDGEASRSRFMLGKT